MSNLQNTIRVPLQTSMTNKWKSHTSLTKDTFGRKTRTLEDNLNKQKLTLQRNKAKSTIEIYDRCTLNKEILQYANHTSHNKPTVNLFSTKSSTIKQILKCGQCEKEEAKMKCLECIENYCADCFAHFHLRGALQRHRCILLSNKQSNIQESEELLNEKRNLASFQQSFLQWRDNNINKSKKNQLLSPIFDRIEYSQKLPNIEFNSSKKSQSNMKTNQENFIQRSKRINLSKNNQPKINVLINIHHSLSDNTVLNDSNVDIKPLHNDLSTMQTIESVQTTAPEENLDNNINIEQNEEQEQERPITHISTISCSRSNSSSIKRNSIPLKSNSITNFQQSLLSELTTKSNDELEAIIDSQLILSRSSSSSSSTLKKFDQPINLLSQNWIPKQSTSDKINIRTIIVDQYSIDQFDLALDDLLDVTKIEIANRLNYLSDNILPNLSEKDKFSNHIITINSPITTPHRNSPFSFTNSLNKTNRNYSSSSIDTGDGGFFTDVLPRQIISSPIPPPPILECSTSNEWKNTLDNQPTEEYQTIPDLVTLYKSSVENLSCTSSKHSVILEEINHQSKSQSNNNSRSASSQSSSSLPISITSSRKNSSSSTSTVQNSSLATSIAQNSSSSPLKSKNFSSPTSKSSSAAMTTKTSSSQSEATIPIIVEDKKVSSLSNNDECLQEPMNSLEYKSSSNVHISQNSNDLLKSNSITYLTRDKNITTNDLPTEKKTHHPRQIMTNNKSSNFRKLEFSVGDGLKWQEASIESMSSTKTVSSNQSSTLSNLINTKLAEQFSVYDNDDGRSSRTYQNVNDEECFNELRQELCSELTMKSSDEDAILNEHLLKILQNDTLPYNQKDLLMIESKLQ